MSSSYEDKKLAAAGVEDISAAHDQVHEVNTASVALAAAVAADKPKLWSKSMLRLYFIIGTGYLISTMNGFDGSLMVCLLFPSTRLADIT